jgi:hypothetical protein
MFAVPLYLDSVSLSHGADVPEIPVANAGRAKTDKNKAQNFCMFSPFFQNNHQTENRVVGG